MTELLDDTWSNRDFPVLRELARHFDRDQQIVRVPAVAEATGLREPDVIAAGRALASAGLVDVLGAMGHPVIAFRSISAEARRLTGLWPTPEAAVDRLLAALDDAIRRAATAEERTRLEKFREGAAGVGTSLLVGVTTAMITGQLPQ